MKLASYSGPAAPRQVADEAAGSRDCSSPPRARPPWQRVPTTIVPTSRLGLIGFGAGRRALSRSGLDALLFLALGFVLPVSLPLLESFRSPGLGPVGLEDRDDLLHHLRVPHDHADLPTRV